MKIRLHLGAHKTATSHFQASLAASRSELADIGVSYPDVFTVRRHYTSLIRLIEKNKLSLVEAQRKVHDTLPRDLGDADTLLLSDENFIGLYIGTLQTSRMYPMAKVRLEILRELIGPAEIECFFTVRRYDDFFSSLYCEALRQHSMPDFEACRPKVTKSSGWGPVVDVISEVFGSKPVLFRYEDYRDSPALALSLYSGLLLENITLDKRKNLRQSMSTQAVRLLSAIGSANGDFGDHKKLVSLVQDHVRISPGDPRFYPWSEREKESFADAYNGFIEKYADSFATGLVKE